MNQDEHLRAEPGVGVEWEVSLTDMADSRKSGFEGKHLSLDSLEA